MTPPLGLIEGRFGPIWSAQERSYVVQTLAAAGYGFYHYGPKGDRCLRRDWRVSHSAQDSAYLEQLAEECRSAGMRFGMALTPVGSTHPFDDAVRSDLLRRLEDFDRIGVDDLAILFDDLRGDMPQLAERQAEVVNFCAQNSRAMQVYTCPTYYSDDPVLDLVFADRPAGYLGELGRRLDPAIQVYWTGEEVCAREISPAHLEQVAGQLGRPVCLWDNYPVNDGARMSRFVHLRAFTGRSAVIAQHISGHAINPAIQAHLGCIPALTLPMVYDEGERYAYGAAFRTAAHALLGDEFAQLLAQDILAFQDVGLERLGERAERLRARYANINHPAAREILQWLDGQSLMTDNEVQTQ